MKNLKIWQKLLLLAAVFTLPFLIVTATLLSTVKEQVDFAQGELTGVEYARPLLQLADALRNQRALADRVIAGAPLQSQLDAGAGEVQAAMRAVDAVYARADGAGFGARRWAEVRSAISALLEQRGRNAQQSFDAYSKAIHDVAGLVASVGDVSKLILDPQLDSYYLMITLLTEGPQLSEYLAQARLLAYPVPGGPSPERMDRMRGLAALTAAADERLATSLASAVSADAALAESLEARAQAVSAEVRQTRETIARLSGAADAPTGAPGATGIGSVRSGALLKLQEALAPALSASLEKRKGSYAVRLRDSFVVALLALLFVLVVGGYIVRSITRPLAQVVGVANQIAVGNLNVEVLDAHRQDEIGSLARAFDRMLSALRDQVLLVQDIAEGDLTGSIKPQSANDDMGNALGEMVQHLSALVSEVHKSGIQVNTSATQISATAREQHSTATEIAATTTEIGATSKEISATSKEMVRTMAEVAAAAEQSASLANSGQHGLTQMEETHAPGDGGDRFDQREIGRIERKGRQHHPGGDHHHPRCRPDQPALAQRRHRGREGRRIRPRLQRGGDGNPSPRRPDGSRDLRHRADGASEIQSAVSAGVMGMDKFSEEVRRGIEEVEQVGSQLSQIIQQVQQMAPRFEAVSEGMRAQATGAEQITQALSQLAEAALQTVESLRQSNQAIDGLHQSATGLREGVSRFKLAN